MLRGSVKAPPSARRSPAFASLAAASEAEVTRWVRALEVAGALVEVERDGFRVLQVGSHVTLPSLAAAAPTTGEAAPLVAELRAWRTRRAREDGVPAYVVLHDATLQELAARRPGSPAELAVVKGLGPTKIERYGDELLNVLATV
jgi:superfamily II DNA helicase RecQ